jgi:SRSO17 transposase
MTSMVSSSPLGPEVVWSAAFDEVGKRIGPLFGRPQTRERVQAYLRGLLSPVERKNGWQLAEEAGETTPYAMQYLLDRAKWNADLLRDELRSYVTEKLGDERVILPIDETGFVKKGDKSAGVQRQYSGTAGRIENCQIGVFLTYSSPKGHCLIDRELYLPKSWTENPARCQQADVPAEVKFATKPELAIRMLTRCFDAAIKPCWVVGDSVYGSSRPLRAFLEDRQQAYAMAVSCQEQVVVAGTPQRVDELARAVPADAWQCLSAGNGSKGPRVYNWTSIALKEAEIAGWQHWLVIRQSLSTGGKLPEMAYVLVFAPVGTTLQEMVEAIGSRWTVEQCFEEAKGEVGLDQYEVRSWQGWYRHITLCMLAHAFLTHLRASSQSDEADEGEEDNKKKLLRQTRPQPPLGTLSAFKRKRGLTCL